MEDISAREVEEADRIITEYCRVMVRRAEIVRDLSQPHLQDAALSIAPVSTLPYSKEQIRRAIELAFMVSENDAEAISAFISAYTSLAQYVADEDATKVYTWAAAREHPGHPGNRLEGQAMAVYAAALREETVLLKELLVFLSGLPGSRKDIAEAMRQITDCLLCR
jgi:hypothetical protein